MVVDIFWLVVGGDGWWWMVVGRGGWWHSFVEPLGNFQKFIRYFFLEHLNMAAPNTFTESKNLNESETLLVYFPWDHFSNHATKFTITK